MEKKRLSLGWCFSIAIGTTAFVVFVGQLSLRNKGGLPPGKPAASHRDILVGEPGETSNANTRIVQSNEPAIEVLKLVKKTSMWLLREEIEGYRASDGKLVPHGKYVARTNTSVFRPEAEDPCLLNEEGHYEHGRKVGVWKLYQRANSKFDKARKELVVEDAGIYQGVVIKKEGQTYKDGKREGAFTSWNDFGDLVMTGLYVADKKDGTWTLFRYGERKSEEAYVNGKKNGPAVYYDRQSPRPDHKVSEGAYKDDNRVGVWKAYNLRNGLVREETTYDENGTKRAIRDFWDDGKPRMEATFNDRGVKDGVQRQWNSEGKLTTERIYENGKPLPRKNGK